MGILDRILGRDDESRPAQQPTAGSSEAVDTLAIDRYRYMLKTAPPETIEQAHAEAFAKLTPEQRSMVLQQLSADLPDSERSATGAAAKDDPQSLARLATRAEVRRPGALERAFSGISDRGIGMGGLMLGGFLSSIAGAVVGSAIAQSFLGEPGIGDTAQGDINSGDLTSDGSADAGSDVGDFDGGDFGEV